MENFRRMRDVVQLAAASVDDSNKILHKVAMQPWNVATPCGLLAQAVLDKRIELVSDLRNSSASFSEEKLEFAQYSPVARLAISKDLLSITQLQTLLDRLHEIDRNWQQSFQLLASGDREPRIRELCGQIALLFHLHLQACFIMEQAAYET